VRATTIIHRSVMRDGDVYIGRGSKWGNPFVIGEQGDREAVVNMYRGWIQTQPDLLVALPELQGKRLACHCHPLPCHGDVLAKLANALPVGDPA
jgi:hypothetical protein